MPIRLKFIVALDLAICHWHLGHEKEARSWYDKARSALEREPDAWWVYHHQLGEVKAVLEKKR